MNIPTQQEWRQYCEDERSTLEPILDAHGYTLATEQPHLKGERFLMQAVTTESGRKLILLGTDQSGVPVVIKATRDAAGVRELQHERRCRTVLNQMQFAAEIFTTPPEMAWIEERGFTISVTKFIAQSIPFLERPIEEQFDIALRAFTAQEGAHATTYNHRKLIKSVYDLRTATDYQQQFNQYTDNLSEYVSEETNTSLKAVASLLTEHQRTIDQYGGFLTHTDFVPHNFRIDESGTLYLLDYSSLTFGNKYEGWARFLNFMALYNPPLTRHLTTFVRDNRTPEESVALKIMRLYRLGELMSYYHSKISVSDGSLLQLNKTRVTFWATILKHVLKDEPIPAVVISKYQVTRDSLRSEDEKERQQGLH